MCGCFLVLPLFLLFSSSIAWARLAASAVAAVGEAVVFRSRITGALSHFSPGWFQDAKPNGSVPSGAWRSFFFGVWVGKFGVTLDSSFISLPFNSLLSPFISV